MSNPQQETKLELVTEAIESLVLAQVVALAPDDIKPPNAHETLMDARAGLRAALKELLQPTLRVVTSERESRVGDISTTARRTVAEAANLS